MTAAYIGLGANTGNREANLRMALRGMTRMARIVAVSSLYETEPVGLEGPAFYNAVCRIETGLQPRALLRFLKGLEQEIGRRPGPRAAGWGSRPIDIDVLLYGEAVVEDSDLTVPHPRLAERAFVLVPLAEIAPDAREPASGKAATELLKGVDSASVRRIAERGWDGVAGKAGRIRV